MLRYVLHSTLRSTGKPTKTPTRQPTRQPTREPTREPTIAPTVDIASNATETANLTIDNFQPDEIQGQENPAGTKDGSGAVMFVSFKLHSTLSCSLPLLLWLLHY